MKILAAQINPTVGDIKGNAQKILKGIARGRELSADLVLFPELCLSGYPPEDFLLLSGFLEEVERQLNRIIQETSGIIAIIGIPRRNPAGSEKGIFNSAAIVGNRQLIGFQDKSLLPTYDVFDERRYFEPSENDRVWNLCGKKVGVTICEDLWQHSDLVKFASYKRDPVLDLKEKKPDFVVNISSSPYSVSKFPRRFTVCSKAAMTLECPVILCNQVGGNDSLIFDGYSLYVGSQGQLLGHAKGFEEDYLLIDLSKKMEPVGFMPDEIPDLYKALVLGVRDYFHKSGFTKACLGLSGGIDSALVACIGAEALGHQNILAITMPSRYSTPGSVSDSIQLAKTLNIEIKEIPIEEPFKSYLSILQPHFGNKPPDVTEENLQARIRGMILMAISNKLGYIVLSTGNKSEMAMGYSTLYGDMCGGLGVINDVTKMQIYALSRWINRDKEIIPWNTINKPPSAELKLNQKDSDTLPAYEILDNVLQEYIEEHKSPEEIAKEFNYPLDLVISLVKKIHLNEYKRRQSPPGLRISEKAFSVGRRFPIVQRWI